MEGISLRDAVRGVGIALGVYLIGNLIMAFLVFRPVPVVEVNVVQPSADPPAQTAVPISLIADQAGWQSLSGSWVFAEGGLSQTQTDGYDYSFFAAGQYDKPQISARLHHVAGIGGGIVFNVPSRETLTGGQLVRFLDTTTLIWGYYDPAQGFVAQGTYGIPDPGTRTHTLAVTQTDTTYGVELDGLPVAVDVPLISQSGYLGLTASLAYVVFEEFTVR